MVWPVGLHVDSIKAFPSVGTASLDESTSNAGGIVFQVCQNRQLRLLVWVLQFSTWWIYCTTCIPCIRLYRRIDTSEDCTFLSPRLFVEVILEYLFAVFVVWTICRLVIFPCISMHQNKRFGVLYNSCINIFVVLSIENAALNSSIYTIYCLGNL